MPTLLHQKVKGKAFCITHTTFSLAYNSIYLCDKIFHKMLIVYYELLHNVQKNYTL
jgi:hypothetical protein